MNIIPGTRMRTTFDIYVFTKHCVLQQANIKTDIDIKHFIYQSIVL